MPRRAVWSRLPLIEAVALWIFTVETVTYQLMYTDAATGRVVTRNVDEMRVAQQLAKELAKASGRRAVITRLRETQLWNARIVDTLTGEVWQVLSNVTKADVVRHFRAWRERKTACVLVAWPQWLPQPVITISRAG